MHVELCSAKGHDLSFSAGYLLLANVREMVSTLQWAGNHNSQVWSKEIGEYFGQGGGGLFFQMSNVKCQ